MAPVFVLSRLHSRFQTPDLHQATAESQDGHCRAEEDVQVDLAADNPALGRDANERGQGIHVASCVKSPSNTRLLRSCTLEGDAWG